MQWLCTRIDALNDMVMSSLPTAGTAKRHTQPKCSTTSLRTHQSDRRLPLGLLRLQALLRLQDPWRPGRLRTGWSKSLYTARRHKRLDQFRLRLMAPTGMSLWSSAQQGPAAELICPASI